jgi:L-asparaginase/beta-aspartyl-peptidase (threonine type)
MPHIIVVHGGVSFPDKFSDVVRKAAEVALQVLTENKGTALGAAVAAVIYLEDDGRFDAGLGSYYNLEGEIEMDAAVMDEKGNCGAVAAIKDVRNPILVAYDLIGTPHILLAGEGAQKGQRTGGITSYPEPWGR